MTRDARCRLCPRASLCAGIHTPTMLLAPQGIKRHKAARSPPSEQNGALPTLSALTLRASRSPSLLPPASSSSPLPPPSNPRGTSCEAAPEAARDPPQPNLHEGVSQVTGSVHDRQVPPGHNLDLQLPRHLPAAPPSSSSSPSPPVTLR